MTDVWNLMDVTGQITYLVFSVYDLLKLYEVLEFNILMENIVIVSLLLLLLRAVSLLRIWK